MESPPILLKGSRRGFGSRKLLYDRRAQKSSLKQVCEEGPTFPYLTSIGSKHYVIIAKKAVSFLCLISTIVTRFLFT